MPRVVVDYLQAALLERPRRGRFAALPVADLGQAALDGLADVAGYGA